MEEAKKLVFLQRAQFCILLFFSICFLWAAPSDWNHTPDSGVYIGTAEALIETGEYRFNAYPNLLYYPGLSSVLAIVIAIFGTDFHVLHLFTAALTILAIWFSRSYFSYSRYGLAGLITPVFLACASLYQKHTQFILTDGLFLSLTLAALLAWRNYSEDRSKLSLWICVGLVAYASLTRFHGLFLWGAFTGALILHNFSLSRSFLSSMSNSSLPAVIAIAPFLGWTIRNAMLHTPDTSNMANSFFFGLHGIKLHASTANLQDWIDADWKYGAYATLNFVRDFEFFFLPNRLVSMWPWVFGVAVTSVLIFLGAIPWFRRASAMERLYLAVSVIFLFKGLLLKNNLYWVTRHWLPILPFFTLAIVYGVRYLANAIPYRYEIFVKGVGWSIFCLVLITGISTSLSLSSSERRTSLNAAAESLAELREFVNQNIPEDAVIATVDWGILPWTMDRTSYQLLNDPGHEESVERILKYQAEYLVSMDEISFMGPFADSLVDDIPEAFSLEFQFAPSSDQKGVTVYKIDRSRLQLPTSFKYKPIVDHGAPLK